MSNTFDGLTGGMFCLFVFLIVSVRVRVGLMDDNRDFNGSPPESTMRWRVPLELL